MSAFSRVLLGCGCAIMLCVLAIGYVAVLMAIVTYALALAFGGR